ncbi:MAG: phage baseplate assembly protein V [Terracidiphilus sp.]
MSTSLIDILSPPDEQRTGRYYGVVVGIVIDNQDPNNMARVRVSFPWLSDDNQSWWARIAVPMAGSGRGTYFLPEVNDEVLVAFEHGDVRSPYIVGALWNGKDAPPTNNSDGQNNLRLIHSRSGHLIRLDDTDGDEKIEVIDKTGGNKITIKSSDNSMSLECTGDMSLDCKGKMTLNATAGIEMTSDADIKIRADATMDIESTAPMTIKGAIVSIN